MPHFGGKINEQFYFKNAQNLTHELLILILTKIFFCYNWHKKLVVSNLVHFQNKIAHLFIIQNEVLRSKRVKQSKITYLKRFSSCNSRTVTAGETTVKSSEASSERIPVHGYERGSSGSWIH